MITGTHYFVSVAGAIKYYKSQGYYGTKLNNVIDEVNEKLAEGLIKIGKPSLTNGQKLVMMDNNTRYGIEDTQS